MALFFPSTTNETKINASSNQIGISVGDSMSISAGNSFSIAGGSSSSIKLGPSTSFSIGSAVNINIDSSISYTYGFSASYGGATSAMSTTSTAKAIDSYEIQAGVFTAVKQAALSERAQVLTMLSATIASMGVIALAVVNGLSRPMFVADTSDPSNPDAVVDDGNKLSAACSIAITTTTVFILQWALTYILARSSGFSAVTSMLFNNTGISASVQTSEAKTKNAMLAKTVPSVETIMFASQGDNPVLTHRVNRAPLGGISPESSELVLQPDSVSINSMTKGAGGVMTKNTQIKLDPVAQQISFFADSVAAQSLGNMSIGQNTAITNPNGTTTLSSFDGGILNNAILKLNGQESAILSCTDGTPVGTGSVVASPTAVNIGVSKLNGGSAVFDSSGSTISGAAVKIMGTTIDIGGAITVIGGPGQQPNVQLSSVLTDITEAKTGQAQLMAQIRQLEAQMLGLKISMEASMSAAIVERELLTASAY